MVVLLIAAFVLGLGNRRVCSADPKKWRSPCKIIHPSDANIEWECIQLKRGRSLEELFGDQWADVARFNRIDRRHARPGTFLKVPLDLDDLKKFTPLPLYLPLAESEEQFILIDLSEQFLGAYEFGQLVFSVPAATGEKGNETPTGEFRIGAADPNHKSSVYFIEKTKTPYPMNYALRFHVSKEGISYWIHGRDLPGYPASHGCIGLYDEGMQAKHYKYPKSPILEDAKLLYEWVTGPVDDKNGYHIIKNGPRVLIIGSGP